MRVALFGVKNCPYLVGVQICRVCIAHVNEWSLLLFDPLFFNVFFLIFSFFLYWGGGGGAIRTT